jgi:hypothetical protein
LDCELVLAVGAVALVVVDADVDSLDGAGVVASPDGATVGVAGDFAPRLSFL